MYLNIFSHEYKISNSPLNRWGIRRIYEDAMEGANEEWEERDQTAGIAFITTKGKWIYGEETQCHAQLNEAEGFDFDNEVKYVINFYHYPHEGISREKQLRYINWLINESPYADVFIVKDPEEVIDRFYTCRVDVPANMLVGALVCGRFLSEEKNNNAFPVWYRLATLRKDLNAAFAFSHVFRASSARTLFPIKLVSGEDYHNLICFSQASVDTVRNFVTDNKTNLEPNFNECWSYNRIENLWEVGISDEYNGYHDRSFFNYCQTLQPLSNTLGQNYNIFKPLNYYEATGDYYEIIDDNDLSNVFDQMYSYLIKD